MTSSTKRATVATMARAGLIAKGIVYLLLGAIAFMAAFELGRSAGDSVSHESAFSSIEDLPGGKALLYVLAAGLFSYTAWRMNQAFMDTNNEKIKMSTRARYFFSGVAYLLLTISVVRFAMHEPGKGGDDKQQMAADMMSQPFGSWMVIAAGIILGTIGIYQVYYGLSEKYKKHVRSIDIHDTTSSFLVAAGKVGYVARGIVWLLLSYMLLNAGFSHNSSEAGDTGKAFRLLESGTMGSYLAGAVGLGLIAYGLFSFIRARYEKFN